MRRAAHLVGLVAVIGSARADEPNIPFLETFDAGAQARWQVMTGTWEFAGGTAKQTAPAYDCGAGLALRPPGAFYIAVRFRPEASMNGGGLFFALPAPSRRNGGLMVRYDVGGRVLWGRFNHGGEFEYYGDAASPDVGSVVHELAVAVDPNKLACNIYHNGKRIATNVRICRTRGFVGLQSSGGAHTFTRFEVRPATAEELDGLQSSGTYSRIVGLVGDARRVVALRQAPEFLVHYDAAGQKVAGADVAALRGLEGDELQPVALARDRNDGVLVLAEDGSALYRFDRDLRQVGGGPLWRDPNLHGTGLAVGPQGHILVSAPAVPGIRLHDPAGQPLLAFGEKGQIDAYAPPKPESAGKFDEPAGLAVDSDGRVLIADRGNCTYVVYQFDSQRHTFEWVTNGPWLPRVNDVQFDSEPGRAAEKPARGILLAGPHEYYAPHGALRILGPDGLGQSVFLGSSIGGLSSHIRLCTGPGGKFYIADADKDRIVILPPNFTEKSPSFEWLPDGGVLLTMTKTDGTASTTINHVRSTEGGRITIRQREPICDAWPPISAASLLTYSLPAAPPDGKTYVIDWPVLVAVVTKATDEQGREVTINPEGVVERLQRELDRVRRFYWLSSHCLLNVRYEFVLVEEPGAKIVDGWIPPGEGRRLANAARRRLGWSPIGAEHSLVVIYPRAGFDPHTTDDPGCVGGGGLTDFAYSSYALWNHGQAWLMAHEWGHQLDMYFDKSGLPDWWLNHPDGTVHIGRYGEHWDCNAFLCRRVDKMNWLRLRFGTPRLVDDRDGDGLADDDPAVPLDERRFGSDPAKVDTDGDGLGDLREATAGTFSSADPTNPDTNQDGVRDGQDPTPQFRVGHVLRGAAPRPDGQIVTVDLSAVGSMERDWCSAGVAGGYDPDHVYLSLTISKPVRTIHAPVDFNNDGWFVGHDNVYATVTLEWPGSGPVHVKQAAGCDARVTGQGAGVAVLVLTIPRPSGRAPLQAGSSIGLSLRCENGEGVVAFLLDPWQILGFELQ